MDTLLSMFDVVTEITVTITETDLLYSQAVLVTTAFRRVAYTPSCKPACRAYRWQGVRSRMRQMRDSDSIGCSNKLRDDLFAQVRVLATWQGAIIHSYGRRSLQMVDKISSSYAGGDVS